MGKREFLTAIRDARAGLAAVLATKSETALSETILPGLSWTTKEVLAHLIGYDLAVLKACADVRAGQQPKWGWTYPNFDEWNESQVWPRRSRSFAAVRAELDDSRARLLAELDRWPEDAGPFGPDTWDVTTSAISWVAHHERDHTELIAKL